MLKFLIFQNIGMIARTMKCYDCKREVIEKMTNDDYSDYLQKRKQVEKQGIGYGWFCNYCINKKCVMCRIRQAVKYIPAKKEGEIRKKIPTCQICFDRFRDKLGFTEEISPKLLEPLPNLTHEEWTKFLEEFKK
jgi:hypothetical protein